MAILFVRMEQHAVVMAWSITAPVPMALQAKTVKLVSKYSFVVWSSRGQGTVGTV